MRGLLVENSGFIGVYTDYSQGVVLCLEGLILKLR